MRRNLIIIVLVLVAVGLTVYFMFTQKKSPQQVQETQQGIPMVESGDKSNDQKSQYVQYSESALENITAGRRVLFFYASWCPTCRPADTDFRQNVSKLPADVTIVRVNYNDNDTDDQEKALAKKYEVGYQHTFVQIDASGNKVSKWTGGSIEELLENIK